MKLLVVLVWAATFASGFAEYFGTGTRSGLGSFVNDYDKDMQFICPGDDEILTRVYSEHANQQQDRRWKFACTDMTAPSGDVSSKNCAWTDFLNTYDHKLDFQCSRHEFIRGLYSEHENQQEDRRWQAYCCEMWWSKTDTRIERDGGSYSGYVNDLNGPLDYSAPTDTFLVGMAGEHNNELEDREYGFYYASVAKGTCSSPSAPNLNGNCESTAYEDTCSVSCAAPYTLSGNETITCNGQAGWVSLPSCIPPCDAPNIPNSDSAVCAVTPSGNSCSVRCDAGYSMTSGSSGITCLSPTWSSLPTCEPSPCSMPIESATEDTTECLFDTPDRGTCLVVCLDEYNLRDGDSNSVSCSFGIWSDSPKCI